MLLYPPCSCYDIIPVFLSLFDIYSSIHLFVHSLYTCTHFFIPSLFDHALMIVLLFFRSFSHSRKIILHTKTYIHIQRERETHQLTYICSSPLETRALCGCIPSSCTLYPSSLIHIALYIQR